MSITTQEELEGMKAVSAVVQLVLEAMRSAVQPGITTAELDAVGAEVMRENKARSAPAMMYGFPGNTCISLNEEAVHGVPGKRALLDGDLIKLDVTVEKNGYVADAAVTLSVGHVQNAEHQRLIACAERAFQESMSVARAGMRISEIGRMIEREVRREHFSVIRELGGHGVGRAIHEEPSVPNYYEPSSRQVLTEGLVITVEPIITSGRGRAVMEKDGWTIRTTDRQPVAHFEHTIVVTKDKPLVLTAAK
jgi:methionyl aminopeptidase